MHRQKRVKGKQVQQPSSLLFIFTLVMAGWFAVLVWTSGERLPLGLPMASHFLDAQRFGVFEFSSFFLHWLQTIKNIILLTCMFISAYGLGRFGLMKMSRDNLSRLEQVVYALGLGFLSMSLMVMLLGLSQLLYSWIAMLLLGGTTLLGSRILLKDHKNLIPKKEYFFTELNLTDKLFILVVTGLMVFVFINANAPELFFDSLVYHLAVPYHWVKMHGIVPMPTVFFSNMPIGIEMLYTWVLLLSDERLCRLLHASLGVLTGVTIFAIARRWFGKATALWSAGLFLSVPVVVMNMQESGVDVGTTFFAVCALGSFLNWYQSMLSEPSDKPSPKLFKLDSRSFLPGLFIGMALFCKYTTAFILAPLVIIGFLMLGFRKTVTFKKVIPPFLWMSIGVMICLIPLFGKNFAFTGNPVYPFLYKIISSDNIHENKMEQQMGGFKEFGKRTWQQYLKQPWELTFYMPTSNSYAGVVWLFLLPLVIGLFFLGKEKPPLLNLFLWPWLLGTLIWSTQTQIVRYYIAIFPVAAIIGGFILNQWQTKYPARSLLAKWAVVMFVIWSGMNTITIGLQNWDPVGVSFGLEKPQHYLNRKLMSSYVDIAQIANQLPESSKLLLVGETRSYYFKHEATAATVYDHQPLIQMIDEQKTAQKVWLGLKESGYTHVMVHLDEAARTRGYEPYQWDVQAIRCYQELTSYYFNPIAIRGKQFLYEIRQQPDENQTFKAGRPLFTYTTKEIGTIRAMSREVNRARSYDEAIRLWKNIIAIAPDWWTPYEAIAWVYYQKKDILNARLMYGKAEQLGFLSATGYLHFGVVHTGFHDYKQALRCFEAALAINPHMDVARKNIELIKGTADTKR